MEWGITSEQLMSWGTTHALHKSRADKAFVVVVVVVVVWSDRNPPPQRTPRGSKSHVAALFDQYRSVAT